MIEYRLPRGFRISPLEGQDHLLMFGNHHFKHIRGVSTQTVGDRSHYPRSAFKYLFGFWVVCDSIYTFVESDILLRRYHGLS